MLRSRLATVVVAATFATVGLSGHAPLQAAPSSPCSFLGIPVCCWCAWSCTASWTYLGAANGRDKLAEADADCCASCCPDTPAAPQNNKCTVQAQSKFTLTVSGGISVDPIEFGLEAGWENQTIAGTECSANCTDCNTGECEGGFNWTEKSWRYREVCTGSTTGRTATVKVKQLTSVYCESATGSCERGGNGTGGSTGGSTGGTTGGTTGDHTDTGSDSETEWTTETDPCDEVVYESTGD